jgi:hypothetical protein
MGLQDYVEERLQVGCSLLSQEFSFLEVAEVCHQSLFQFRFCMHQCHGVSKFIVVAYKVVRCLVPGGIKQFLLWEGSLGVIYPKRDMHSR